MIDDGLGFQLVPWTPSIEKHLGRHISGSRARRRWRRLELRPQAGAGQVSTGSVKACCVRYRRHPANRRQSCERACATHCAHGCSAVPFDPMRRCLSASRHSCDLRGNRLVCFVRAPQPTRICVDHELCRERKSFGAKSSSSSRSSSPPPGRRRSGRPGVSAFSPSSARPGSRSQAGRSTIRRPSSGGGISTTPMPRRSSSRAPSSLPRAASSPSRWRSSCPSGARARRRMSTPTARRAGRRPEEVKAAGLLGPDGVVLGKLEGRLSAP